MRISRGLIAFLAGMSFSASAFAATVNATQGQVLVNRGQGYQRVAGSTQANAGATVVVNPGGSGEIVYPDGCVVKVDPGSVYTIAPESPCKTGALTPGTTFAIGAVVVGGGIAAVVLLSQGDSDKKASP